MSYDEDDREPDSERMDDLPRRRRYSCGPERLCGADDCCSCFPGEHEPDEVQQDDDDDEVTP